MSGQPGQVPPWGTIDRVRWTDKTVKGVADLAGAIAEGSKDGSGPAIALVALSTLIPYDRGVLCRADGESLVPVATVGHGGSVAAAVGRMEYRREQRSLGMDLSGAALRFDDLPGRGRSCFTVTELAWPAGLRDGIGMSLRASDGRFIGHVALNATREGSFSEDHRDLLTLLNRSLSAALRDGVRLPRSGALGLTARELTVLELIGQGYTNGEIAKFLVISASTVRRHVEHLLAKLGVSSRTEAAVKASRYGLLS